MDHFYEDETEEHSWNVLATLLRNTECHEILVETGMYVIVQSNTYYMIKISNTIDSLGQYGSRDIDIIVD